MATIKPTYAHIITRPRTFAHARALTSLGGPLCRTLNTTRWPKGRPGPFPRPAGSQSSALG
eukprot:3179670-Pyramimonas_sp.AAC.1